MESDQEGDGKNRMNFTYYIITPETITPKPMQREELWDLDSMYSIIGCDMVEVHALPRRYNELDGFELIMDEDAGLKPNVPRNPSASALIGRDILGTVILTPLNTID
jgi:hypothetical protein